MRTSTRRERGRAAAAAGGETPCAPHVCRSVEHDVERVQVPPLPLDPPRLAARLDAALRAEGGLVQPGDARALVLSQPLGGWPYGAPAATQEAAPAAASSTPARPPALWPFSAFSALVVLRLDGAGISEVPECIFALSRTLTALSLISNRLAALPARLGELTLLQELDVSSNGIVRIAPETLAPLQELRYLYVRDNDLSSVALPRLERLHTLALSGNEGVGGAVPAGVAVAVAALPHLAVLQLAGCRLASGSTRTERSANAVALGELLARFVGAPLRHLSLAGNGLDDMRALALVGAAARLWGQTLQELDLSHNAGVRLGKKAGRIFAFEALRKALPKLTMLRLANACLGTGALRRLTPPMVAVAVEVEAEVAVEVAHGGAELAVDVSGALSAVTAEAVNMWLKIVAASGTLRVLSEPPPHANDIHWVSGAADAVHSDWLLVGSQRAALDRAALLARAPAVTTIVSVLDGAETPYTRDFYYHVYPLEDDGVANMRAILDRATACIARAREERGGAVLVHCHAGRSRSATVALAYILRYARTPRTRTRMSPEQAIDAVSDAVVSMQKRRQEVNPSAHFQRVLAEWAADTLLY